MLVDTPAGDRRAARPQRSGAPLSAEAAHVLMLQRRLGNSLTSELLAGGRGQRRAAAPAPAEMSRSPALQRYFQYKDPRHQPPIDLRAHQPAIRDAVAHASASDAKTLKNFDSAARAKGARDFDAWAEKNGVASWKQILKDEAGLDIALEEDREQRVFGVQQRTAAGKPTPQFRTGRIEGSTQSGMIPTHPGSGAPMLTQVPRRGAGAYDYTVGEDTRILQLLRQVSTQLYGYLTDIEKLAEEEQEIQTMFSYGSLLVTSNRPETGLNLYRELRALKGASNVHEAVFEFPSRAAATVVRSSSSSRRASARRS